MFEQTSKIAGHKRISSGKIKTARPSASDQGNKTKEDSGKRTAENELFWFDSGEPSVLFGSHFGSSSSLGVFWPDECGTLNDDASFRLEPGGLNEAPRALSPGVSDPSCGGCDSETHCTDACSPPCSGDESCTAVNPCFDPSCMGEPCFKKRCVTPNCIERDCPDNHCSESICFDEPCPSQTDAIPCDFEHFEPHSSAGFTEIETEHSGHGSIFAQSNSGQARDGTIFAPEVQRSWQSSDPAFTSRDISQIPWHSGSTDQHDSARQLSAFSHNSTLGEPLTLGHNNYSSVANPFPRTDSTYMPIPQYSDALLLSNFYDTNHNPDAISTILTAHSLNRQQNFIVSPHFSGYESSPATPQLSQQIIPPTHVARSFSVNAQSTDLLKKDDSQLQPTWSDIGRNEKVSGNIHVSKGTQTQPFTSATKKSSSLKVAHTCQWAISETEEEPILCSEEFESEDVLQAHVKEQHIKHKNNGPFCCLWEGCSSNRDKDFGSKSKLGRHVQIHTGSKGPTRLYTLQKPLTTG